MANYTTLLRRLFIEKKKKRSDYLFGILYSNSGFRQLDSCYGSVQNPLVIKVRTFLLLTRTQGEGRC